MTTVFILYYIKTLCNVLIVERRKINISRFLEKSNIAHTPNTNITVHI